MTTAQEEETPMGARELIDEARRELDAGHGKNAARLLTEALG